MTDNKDDQFYKDTGKIKDLMHEAHEATKEGTLSHEDFMEASGKLIADMRALRARIDKYISEQKIEKENK